MHILLSNEMNYMYEKFKRSDSHPVGFKKGREAGLTLKGKAVALWRLTSISRWSKAKFK
jgi:hypothetical protein